MATTKPLKVLIAGSGIAGGAFARCLLWAYRDADITIVERAPSLRLSGASIDVRSTAVNIIKEMGIEPEIRANCTNETGTRFLRADGSTVAYFGATGDTEYQGMTSEYEIFRGALAHILIRPALEKAKLIYDETVESYEQHEDKVVVNFTNGKQTESYDLLVAADGVGSRIRAKIVNGKPRDHIRDGGARVAFFTAPRDMLNGSTDSGWRAMPGGRSVYLRPDPSPEGRTRCHFTVSIPKEQKERRERFDKALTAGNDAVMALMEEEFEDGDWLSKETLIEMRKSQDFYGSMFVQVRSPRLQDGRVVLMGDAGYATPGIGTSLAITGGYILAGELLRTGGDVRAATKNYEDILLPYVQSEQMNFDPLSVLCPQTQWAINLRDTIFWTISTLRLDKAVIWVVTKLGIKEKGLELPKYPYPVLAEAKA